MTRSRLATALLLLPLLPAPAAAAPEGGGREEQPFPVGKTTILREEKVVYTVQGRVRIPRGVSICCQRDVYIKAREGPAVIEVEGTLELQGVGAREVILEGVTVEPCEQFKEINVDASIFRNGGGIRTPKGKACDGKLFLELATFQAGTTLDVTLAGGSVDISSCSFQDPVVIRAADPTGSKGNKVRLFVRGCTHAGTKIGFGGGLVVDRVNDVVIQLSRMAGALTAIRDWGTVLRFDGNKVNSETLEFSHSEAGRLPKATVVKCDVYSKKVAAKAPADPSVRDVLTLERCWFQGVIDPKVLAEKIVRDGTGDAENGARIAFGKINDRPLELAGSVDR